MLENKEVRRCAGIVLWTAGFFVFRARGMYQVGRAWEQLRGANYPVANCLGKGVINVHKKASNKFAPVECKRRENANNRQA